MQTQSLQTPTQPTVQRAQEAQPATTEEAFFAPRTDVYETAENLILVADVPGADEQGISVTFEGDVLTIEARAPRREPEGMTLVHRERGTGNYRRTFTVHTPIARDGVAAALTDGVLRVTLPKAKEARVHKIAVTTAPQGRR